MSDLRRRSFVGAATGSLVTGSLIGGAAPAFAQDKPSGTVDIEQVQVAFIGSGNLGGGTLHFQGRSYRFTVGGLGVGGFGVSKMQAHGEVYHLKEVGQFSGAYGQARYGAVAVDKSSGQLWLENPNGVVISLRARRTGLAVSLGADAVIIAMK